MVDTHWDDLRGEHLRYSDRTWELTGDLAVRDTGQVLAVEARQVDDVRHGTARLFFGLQSPTDSLNPGNLGEQFSRLERTENGQYLVVDKERRTYRYRLERLESA